MSAFEQRWTGWPSVRRLLTPELRSSPQIHKVLMIIESPNALAACRFEVELFLQGSDHVEVRHKHARDHGLLVLFGQDADESEDEQEC